MNRTDDGQGRGWSIPARRGGAGSSGRLGVLLVLLVLAWPGAPAEANHIGCGDVLIGPAEYVLDSDILDCAQSPALTLDNGAVLHMKGHALSCLMSSALHFTRGILLLGHVETALHGGVRLDWGFVTHCDVAVEVWRSDSKVEGMLVDSGAPDRVTEIVVRGELNTLRHNLMTHGRYRIEGDEQTIQYNFQNAADVGFIIGGGLAASFGNRIDSNRAVNNTGAGFEIHGDVHRLTRNIAISNTDFGFDVAEGSGHVLKGNLAAWSSAGIRLTDLVSNSVVTENWAEFNTTDLIDMNLQPCGTNTWTKNVFLTATPGCIH